MQGEHAGPHSGGECFAANDATREEFDLSPPLYMRAAKFRYTLAARKPCRLPPYLGSTLRGGLAMALRRICCINPRTECPACELSTGCAYSVCFETVPPEIPLRGLETAPRPVVIEPEWGGREYLPGDELSFNVLMVGWPARFAPYVTEAVRHMAEHGLGARRAPFELVGAEAAVPGEPSEPLRIGHLAPAIDGGGPVELFLVTPLKIVTRQTDRDGNQRRALCTRPEFSDIVKNLLLRCNSLLALYADGPMEIVPAAVLERARSVECISMQTYRKDIGRFSNRRKKKERLSGILGRLVYDGEGLEDFLPLLRAGAVLHAGKNTAFGFGRYELRPAAF